MTAFLAAYGVIAFIVFALFMFPVFQDWRDYSAKEVRGCVLFSLCAGLLWPIIAVFLITLACCSAYFLRKDRAGISGDKD